MGLGVLASSGATVVSGRISDALEVRALVTLPAFGLLAAGFAVLAFVTSLAGLVGGVVLVGVGVGSAGPALLATLGDLSPADDVGKLGGLYNVFGDVGLSLGPLVALPAVSAVGFTVTYSVSALVAVACLLLVNATLLATPDT
jgi:MFS family permease